MKITNVTQALLSTSHGKYVCVQDTLRPKPSHQLVAQNEQECNPKHSVNVYDIEYDKDKDKDKDKNRRYMAFGFELENKSVFPVVTHNDQVTFKVLPTNMPITEGTFDESFLFKWGEPEISGDWRSLESVAKPRTYLSVEKRGKVIVTKKQDPYFQIVYPKQEEDKKLQSLCRSGKIQENVINSCRKIWRRRNLKRGPSCCEGSAALTKRLRCSDRKTKRMKMSVKS